MPPISDTLYVMKATAPTLSKHLLNEAKRFMGYPDLVGRGKINKEAAKLWDERLLPLGSRCLEWIMPKGQGAHLPAPLLDEYYSKQLLAEIPGIVARAMALRPLESATNVPRQVNVYLEQATRAFVAGLWDGTVALARACLEAVLEERIGQYVGHQDRDLNVWIREAERRRLITNAQSKKARIIQRLGNIVLHEKSASDVDARESVNALRSILCELYR